MARILSLFFFFSYLFREQIWLARQGWEARSMQWEMMEKRGLHGLNIKRTNHNKWLYVRTRSDNQVPCHASLVPVRLQLSSCADRVFVSPRPAFVTHSSQTPRSQIWTVLPRLSCYSLAHPLMELRLVRHCVGSPRHQKPAKRLRITCIQSRTSGTLFVIKPSVKKKRHLLLTRRGQGASKKKENKAEKQRRREIDRERKLTPE